MEDLHLFKKRCPKTLNKRIKNILKIQLNENEIDFDQNDDINLMQYIFNILNQNYQVKILKKLDPIGSDQIYWDIQIDDLKFTLHYEHYLGVSLYISESIVKSTQKQIKAKKMLKEIYTLFKKDKLYS
jgi:hypothetical protein